MLDADAVINNSSQKVGGSNAYPDPAPKKVGGSEPRKTHRIYAAAVVTLVLIIVHGGPKIVRPQTHDHNSVKS